MVRQNRLLYRLYSIPKDKQLLEAIALQIGVTCPLKPTVRKNAFDVLTEVTQDSYSRHKNDAFKIHATRISGDE